MQSSSRGPVGAVWGAAVDDAVVVHPQGALAQVEPARGEPLAEGGAVAEEVVEVFGGQLADVLGAGHHLEAAVLLGGVAQGELDPDLVAGGGDAREQFVDAVPVPALVVGPRQRDVRVEHEPDVVLAEDLPEKGHEVGVLEDLLVEKGGLVRHRHVVAAPAPERVLPLPFDVGVADRLPGLEDAVDLFVRDQVLEHDEPVDAELLDLGGDVRAHRVSSTRISRSTCLPWSGRDSHRARGKWLAVSSCSHRLNRKGRDIAMQSSSRGRPERLGVPRW